MGNFIAKMKESRTDIFMGISVISLISYLAWQYRQEKVFKEKLRKKKIPQVVGSINQVYLKDNVDHLSIQQNAPNTIYKIAITGGPCAGKSTSMKQVQRVFSEKGYRVFAVPQLPTMIVLLGGMILMSKFNTRQRIMFQSLLIRFQMYIEDYMTKLAEMSNMKSIVLCDRGCMDPGAYICKEQLQSILDEEGWSKVVLRDRRYDRVVFLSSAANGAQEFYTLQNNVARSEGIQQAKALDKRTLEVWVGHPHLTIVPNIKGKTFQDKINRVIQAVQKTVGIQVPNARQSKILIKKPTYPNDIHIEEGVRTDIFLIPSNEQHDEDKLTQWGQNSSYCYQRKFRFKKQNNSQFCRQIRRSLTSTQFVMLCQQKDPSRQPVTYNRVKFAYQNTYFTVDKFYINGNEQYILRYFSIGNNPIEMVPQWIEPIRDVTGQKQFKVKYISLKK